MAAHRYIEICIGEEEIEKINGRQKGIRGYRNSCYLDATLFSMFAFTSVFDPILLPDVSLNCGSTEDIELAQESQRILIEDIVNPLRKNYLTPAANVMNLRRAMLHLDNKMTSEEMDPQEFLQLLFHNVLHLDEFISLSSGESDFFHQMLCGDVPESEREQMPTVQQLLRQSFDQQNLKLKIIPRPAFILQMPRSGNNYKTYYKGILPNLTIDITDLIEDITKECTMCGEPATHECRDCHGLSLSPVVSQTQSGPHSTSFCDICMTQVHRRPDRSSHRNIQRINHHQRRTHRVTMDLFAVICIETNHFVSFVKAGVCKNSPWVFFDSMAHRCEKIACKCKGHN